jgi:hypothetical protein
LNEEPTGGNYTIARRLALAILLVAALSSLAPSNKPPSAVASPTRPAGAGGHLTVLAKINVAVPVVTTLHCPKVPLDVGARVAPQNGHLKAPFSLDNQGKDTVFVEFNAANCQPKLLGPYHLESTAETLDVGDVQLEKLSRVNTTRGPEAMRNPEVLKSLHVLDKEQVINSGAPTFPRTTHLPQFGPARPMGVKR